METSPMIIVNKNLYLGKQKAALSMGFIQYAIFHKLVPALAKTKGQFAL